MTDRKERSDRLSKRFQREESEESDGKGSRSREAAAETSRSGQVESDERSVKDRPSVLMYLPEDVRSELDIRFDELNARHKREHGESLEKNRDYYPAVVRAGLSDESLEAILGLDE